MNGPMFVINAESATGGGVPEMTEGNREFADAVSEAIENQVILPWKGTNYRLHVEFKW